MRASAAKIPHVETDYNCLLQTANYVRAGRRSPLADTRCAMSQTAIFRTSGLGYRPAGTGDRLL